MPIYALRILPQTPTPTQTSPEFLITTGPPRTYRVAQYIPRRLRPLSHTAFPPRIYV